MNAHKVRDFFSAHHEGTLERGLAEALERKLSEDPELRAEYAEFVESVELLNSLKSTEIEIPFDLNDRISAAVDRHLLENKKSKGPWFTNYWRQLALGGVAFAAIAFAILSLNRGAGSGPGEAGFGPRAQPQSLPIFSAKNNAVHLNITAKGAQTIVVRQGIDGPIVHQFSVSDQTLDSPLENKSDRAALITIEQGGQAIGRIALPGSKPLTAGKGEGTIAEFAMSIAGYYRQPVVLPALDPKTQVKWDLEGTDPLTTKAQIGSNGELRISKLNDSMLILQ